MKYLNKPRCLAATYQPPSDTFSLGFTSLPGGIRIKLTPPLKWLYNIWTETAKFYVNNASKNYKKILDLGSYSRGLLLGGSIN